MHGYWAVREFTRHRPSDDRHLVVRIVLFAKRTSGATVSMAPEGDEPAPKEQEDPEFWKLKSFAYNLEGNWRIGVIDASRVW